MRQSTKRRYDQVFPPHNSNRLSAQVSKLTKETEISESQINCAAER